MAEVVGGSKEERKRGRHKKGIKGRDKGSLLSGIHVRQGRRSLNSSCLIGAEIELQKQALSLHTAKVLNKAG